MIDLVREQLGEDTDGAPAAEQAYFGKAKLSDEELRDAAAEDQKRRAAERQRHAEADRSNLGLGHDIAAGLIDPTGDQLDALRKIVCHLVADHYREVIAYGAGWTDRERQQPVGDTGQYEPRHTDAIVAAELQRALDEPDPLRGIAQLTARWGAAFVLNPDGVTGPKRSAASGSPASSQTACRAARTRCAPRCGNSCGQCSPPTWRSSIATRSSSTRRRQPCGSTSTAATPISATSTSAPRTETRRRDQAHRPPAPYRGVEARSGHYSHERKGKGRKWHPLCALSGCPARPIQSAAVPTAPGATVEAQPEEVSGE